MNWPFFSLIFKHLFNNNPPEITEELEKAKALHHQGDLQQADAIYQDIIKRFPANAEALHSAAILDYQTGKPDAALVKINKAIRRNPAQVEFLNSKGVVLQYLDRNKEALDILKQGLKLAPQNISLRLNIGNTLRNLKQHAEAIDYYLEVVEHNPLHVGAYCNLGNVYDEIQEYDKAIASYKKALEIDADYNILYTLLAGTLSKAGKLHEAIGYCKKAIELRPGNAEAYNDLGNYYTELNQHKQALECYEQAHALKPDYTVALKNMGVAYQELGMRDKAISCYQQLDEADDGYAEAQHYLTMLDDNVIDVDNLQTLLRMEDEQKNIMHLHYALGKVFSARKEFKQAFEHYRLANSIKRQSITYDAGLNTTYIDGLISFFDSDFIQSTQIKGNTSELPVFIVGMPRSGTTLVEQIISNHSQVVGAGELTAFAEIEQTLQQDQVNIEVYPACLNNIDNTRLLGTAAKYLDVLEKLRTSESRVTDKLPGNFLRIGLIKLLFPSARIIHCKRNPVDTCVSIYTNYFADGYKYAYDLQELARYYVDYRRIMAHWLSLFADSILEVQYEQLVLEQEPVSRQMLDYLALQWEPACLDFHNNQRVVKTASNVQVRQPMYSHAISKWQHYRDDLQPMLEIFSQHGIRVEDVGEK